MAKTTEKPVQEPQEVVSQDPFETTPIDEAIVAKIQQIVETVVQDAVDQALQTNPFLQQLRETVQRISFIQLNQQRRVEEAHYRLDALIQKNKLSGDY